jgi:hypothetical protein
MEELGYKKVCLMNKEQLNDYLMSLPIDKLQKIHNLWWGREYLVRNLMQDFIHTEQELKKHILEVV